MLPSLRSSRRAGRPRTARILVRGGYRPDTIYALVGEPLRLTFRREETAPCSERVVFADLGKSAMLPAYQDVTIELTLDRAGVHEFTCQIGVLHGWLIVEEPS